MKISAIDIGLFRSIKKCHLRLSEITTVLGENNAGKTSLLRALNSVLNWDEEKRYFEDNSHQYAPRTVSKIILTFDSIPDKEIYRGKLNNDKLILRFSYSYIVVDGVKIVPVDIHFTAVGLISLPNEKELLELVE